MIVGCLLCVSKAVGQDAAAEEVVKDNLEVSIFAGAGIPNGGITDFGDTLGAKSGLLVGAAVGYFPTRNFVVGFGLSYTRFGIEATNSVGDQDHRLISPQLYGKYYFFGSSNLVPYAKAALGVDVANFSTRVYDNGTQRYIFRQLSYEPAFSYQLSLGLHYYTFDYGGLFLEAGYHGALSKNAIVDYQNVRFRFDESLSALNVQAGITVFFGSE